MMAGEVAFTSGGIQLNSHIAEALEAKTHAASFNFLLACAPAASKATGLCADGVKPTSTAASEPPKLQLRTHLPHHHSLEARRH
ncbi:hypothetical protein PF007_g3182 [Phytophthora fragariae]|uniref:Uncharacterized protein n=1 Tax=Phytophthora fragariae TaxID=53985 RepID=A0A6A3M2M0_9STRA|nr:hypothetical protein PF011_g2609 [Phytophthora fragariae]KAE9133806.1 hypothetical protein PF007_g3182 [Phytophthora fragariae]KAE9153198.1 hypothetical protein PF006_g2658 [Phytophthora fragariae]